MAMVEFQVGDHTLKTERKLDVFVQGNIVRRLSPLFAGVAGSLAPGGSLGDLADIGTALMSNLAPLTEALTSMKDEDVEYILKKCLAVVVIRSSGAGGWARILSPDGSLQFDNINLLEMYQIVWAVIQENLGGFFPDLGTVSAAPETAQALN